MFIPNAIGLTTSDGNPWPLWVLSPILGFVAVGFAVWDRSTIRIVVALLFGVGAVFILVTTIVAIWGP
ncbi:MAG: hypothetical protein E7A79_03375 [Actinomycetaceae bacterium]|nr:hypothetical protein [Actinomycetaceae bacterium]